MSKRSKGKKGIDTARLEGHLYEESSRATGRRRVDDVGKLLAGIEGRESFPSLDSSSLLSWARDELPGGRFDGVPWFFLAMGKYFETVGKWDDAGTWYGMADERSRKDGNRSVRLDALISLAHLAAKKGERKKAGHLYTTVLKDLKEKGDPLCTMRVLSGMGALKFDEGVFAGARFFFRKVIRLSRKTGDTLWHAHMLNDIGAIDGSAGKLREALVSYRAALETYEKEDYERGITRCLYNIAMVYLNSNKLTTAGEYFSRSQKICDSSGWEEMHILNLLGRADLLARIAEYDASLALCREAKERALLAGDPLSLIEADRLEAAMLFERGERKGCFDLLEEGTLLAKKLQAECALAQVLETRAGLFERDGKSSAAATDKRRVITLWEKMGLARKKRTQEANVKRIKKKGG